MSDDPRLDDLLTKHVADAQMQMLPKKVIPNINIQLSDDMSTSKLESAMYVIMRATNPEHYDAPVAPRMAPCDQYGTSMELLEMKNIYDAHEDARRMTDRSLVSPMSMLAMRMQWGPFNPAGSPNFEPMFPFEHIGIHLGNEKAIVFIVSGGEPVTLTDDKAIFPSDQLVTQVRMLAERQKKT